MVKAIWTRAGDPRWSWYRWATGSVVGTAVILLLVSGQAYELQVLSTAALIASTALGLNVVSGWCGQMSFAQAALYGMGGYASAVCVLRFDLPFPVAFLVAVLVAGALGLVVGFPSIRLSGAYFAIATIGLQMIAVSAWTKGGSLTGGAAGLYGIPYPSIAGFTFSDGLPFTGLCAAWLLLVLLVCSRIRRSRVGWEMRVLGSDEALAASFGIPVGRRKLAAFVIASMIAGGAGAIYSGGFSIVDPNSFGLDLSAMILVMVLIGGRGSIPAVAVAALILSALPEYLRSLDNYRLLVFGVIMVLIILFEPDGLAGIRDRWRDWRSNARRVRLERTPVGKESGPMPIDVSEERGAPTRAQVGR